ncbi:MAG: hypothetical protein QOH50_5270 [Kribbellaceae bacterium]|jgi:hypothetical protein|nr:hypothetical protein [Kribbellaceae bacterium]
MLGGPLPYAVKAVPLGVYAEPLEIIPKSCLDDKTCESFTRVIKERGVERLRVVLEKLPKSPDRTCAWGVRSRS